MFKWRRWRKIYFSNKGAYFMCNKRRWYLHNFMRSNEEDYDGYIAIGAWGGMVIKISDNGEKVKPAFV